jgi:hypothetical protein
MASNVDNQGGPFQRTTGVLWALIVHPQIN